MSEIKSEESRPIKEIIKEKVSIISTASQSLIKASRRSKKKLRSLVKTQSIRSVDSKVDSTGSDKNDSETENQQRWKWKSLVLACVMIIAFVSLSQISIISCGFWATYESNYNKLVHGDERFCYRQLETDLLTEKIKERVIGQDDAISLIEGSLNLVSREKIIQVAFFGSTGVGKTLTANIIMNNFKWKQNVISLIFDINFQAQLIEPASFEDDFNEILPKLFGCGINLVVIDDVSTNSVTIERINQLERRLHRVAKQNLFKIILFVIFKEAADAFAFENELKNFVLVEFQPFTEELFYKCIKLHEKLQNVTLKPKDIEALKFINFTVSGCKTVAKKINLISSK